MTDDLLEQLGIEDPDDPEGDPEPERDGATDIEDLRQIALDQATDALALLEGDFASEAQWPWGTLTDLVGPPLAGELWFVGARPGCGKTTFMMNVMQDHVRHQRPLLYVGMEMPPDRLRMQWAAWACGYEYSKVARKQWDLLPKDAVERLREHVRWQVSPEVRDLVTFADDERVTMGSLREWIERTTASGLQTVIVDHLHRMSWKGGTKDVTGEMAEGVVGLKSYAKLYGIRMLVAAQLRRRATADLLDDYLPPSAAEIKQTGATEQEADSILLLHRSLKAGVTHGDLMKVRLGQQEVADVREENVMRVRVGKCRIDGDARDKSIPLYLHHGVLYATPEERGKAAMEHRYGI